MKSRKQQKELSQILDSKEKIHLIAQRLEILLDHLKYLEEDITELMTHQSVEPVKESRGKSKHSRSPKRAEGFTFWVD